MPHSFHIGRFRVTYRATSPALAAEARDRLDCLVQTQVAESCANVLTRGVAENDSSVLLIRCLNLNLRLAHESENAVANWAEQLASKIRNKLDRTEQDDTVLYFPTRAAYVAQFLRDLAAGRARGKWYYEEFETLFALATSRAVREALSQHTRETLDHLFSIGALREVLSTLTELDAQAIFETWKRQTPSAQTSADRWTGRLLQIWNETRLRDATHLDCPFRDALWWAALTAARHKQADASMFETIRSLLDLRALFSELDLSARESVIQNLAADDLDAAFRIANNRSRETLDFLRRNMQGDIEWARQAQGVLLGEREYVKKSAMRKILTRGPAIPSQFAGIFRLGPSFVAAGIASAELRHLVAMKCVGAKDASDPAIRLFSGFDGDEPAFSEVELPPLETPLLSDDDDYFELDKIPLEADRAGTLWAQAILKHFSRRLIGFHSASARHLFGNFLSGAGFVSDTGDQIVVELPDPALAIVLSIAGILEERYTLPWIEGREIWLQRLPT